MMKGAASHQMARGPPKISGALINETTQQSKLMPQVIH